MSEVNNFDVLKEMSQRGMTTIRLFPASNIMNINRGENGWGSIEIAIDMATASRILNGLIFDANDMPFVHLLVVDRKDFEQVKKELGAENDHGVCMVPVWDDGESLYCPCCGKDYTDSAFIGCPTCDPRARGEG